MKKLYEESYLEKGKWENTVELQYQKRSGKNSLRKPQTPSVLIKLKKAHNLSLELLNIIDLTKNSNYFIRCFKMA